MPPPLSGLLETSVYVADIGRSADFYRTVLGLAPMFESDRLIAFNAGPERVLLVFQRGRSTEDMRFDEGLVPGLDGSGPVHIAFAIPPEHFDAWRSHLAGAEIAIKGEMRWPRGGHSLYFDDPDGNLLEVATPGLWDNY
jgi:catechol 2,3-dioxygenase-like lactoylglutathione lyase family enzyme